MWHSIVSELIWGRLVYTAYITFLEHKSYNFTIWINWININRFSYSVWLPTIDRSSIVRTWQFILFHFWGRFHKIGIFIFLNFSKIHLNIELDVLIEIFATFVKTCSAIDAGICILIVFNVFKINYVLFIKIKDVSL